MLSVWGRVRQRVGQLNGGNYPPSHSRRPNLSFKPLYDRDEEALPPVAKDGVLGPIHVKFALTGNKGSVRDRDREGIETGRLEVLAAWVFARNSGMNPRITPPSSRKAVLVKASAWSSDRLWAVAKTTRKTVLKVRYLKVTLSMGSMGNPMRALSTTEISHLGDEWRGRSKVMFRVRDEIATSQSEPQDPAGEGW
jgi:hypothetical protein